jgi:hypothetical protein
MKEDAFLEKFGEILEAAKKAICQQGIKLFRSGAVDQEEFDDDDYQLPKLILIAALLDEADNWQPKSVTRKFLAILNNLRSF